jgi:hypothetical protein
VDIQKLNKSGRLSEWAEMVGECRNSGKTVLLWCAEHKISPKTYYYRLKHVCEAIPELSKPTSLPVRHEKDAPVFAQITPASRSSRDAAITLRFGSIEVQIHNGAETETIESALRVLTSIVSQSHRHIGTGSKRNQEEKTGCRDYTKVSDH